MFRAIGFAKFIEELGLCYGLPDSEAVIILMILRDSCGPGLQGVISWLSCLIEAYLRLTREYSHAADLQHDALYREFYNLDLDRFNGTLANFNAKFNNLVAKLQLAGVII